MIFSFTRDALTGTLGSDALAFVVGATAPWASLLEAWEREQAGFSFYLLHFLSLVAQGVGVALVIGLPLGLALTRVPRLASPSMSVLAVVQTIPSLALLGLLIPLLGIGRAPTLTATVLYSLLPIVMNTYVGIVGVEPAVRDAARGMGLTARQILWQVELPLALPVVLAGVRTGVVFAIGVITVCALAGAGGLGEYITRGLSRGDNGMVLLGALPILAITLGAFWGIGAVAALAKRRAAAGLLVATLLVGSLAGYAVVQSVGAGNGASRERVVVGCKNFTENYILAEMFRQLVEGRTGLPTATRYGLGSNLAYRALLHGDVDLYPEYTGTLLTATDALAANVPEDKRGITEFVRRGMKERFNLVLLDALGLNNTYAMCVTKSFAVRHQLQSIGDLKRIPQLRAAFADEFLDRPDGWPNLAKLYGIALQTRPVAMTPELMYVALREGQADLCSGFATDWQIAAHDLVVLEDPRGYFPNYHAAPLVSGALLETYPGIADALGVIAGAVSDKVIRELNRAVAEGKRSEVDVAREFLVQGGWLDS